MNNENLCPNNRAKETPQRQVCVDCPARDANEWRLRGLAVRAELRRRKVLDNEMRIVEVILDKSFGWGLLSVVIPELRMFTLLTGMAEPHVHRAIEGLHLARVIRVTKVKGLATYQVREDFMNWQLRPRVARETIRSGVELLREINGLPPLPRVQEELPNFKVQPDTQKSGAGLTKTVITDEIAVTDEETLPYLS